MTFEELEVCWSHMGLCAIYVRVSHGPSTQHAIGLYPSNCRCSKEYANTDHFGAQHTLALDASTVCKRTPPFIHMLENEKLTLKRKKNNDKIEAVAQHSMMNDIAFPKSLFPQINPIPLHCHCVPSNNRTVRTVLG